MGIRPKFATAAAMVAEAATALISGPIYIPFISLDKNRRFNGAGL